MRDVIILHNSFSQPDDELYLSQSGVLEQVDAVGWALRELGIEFEIIAIDNIRQLTSILTAHGEDIIFNLAEEFTNSIEQACYVPAICEAFGKSCTGNDTKALLLCQNKATAKSILSGAGVRCPQGIVITPWQMELLDTLAAGKYMIKPALCDAGEGISLQSVVKLPEDCQKTQQLISRLYEKFEMPIVVEQFIAARELNVAMMQQGNDVRVLAVAEIDFSAFPNDMPKIVDYDAKWQKDCFTYNNTPRKLPAILSGSSYEEIYLMSIAAWNALGCRDYARIDFRIDEQGKAYVIEVNPNPDITPDSGFAAAADYAKVSYGKFVNTMINNALSRLQCLKTATKTKVEYAG